MSLTIVYYCPSAGGNHLKNMINLDPNMVDNRTLDLSIYDRSNQGTAHSREGRNLLVEDLQEIIRQPDKNWCVCAHFGELAPKRDLLLQIPDRRFVIMTIESPTDRWLVESRQQRLGQQCHAYWLHEEQPYLYDRKICSEYWRTTQSIGIAVEHFFNPNLAAHQIVDVLNQFLGTAIPHAQAQGIHSRWWQANFYDPDIVEHYHKHLETPAVAR